MGLSSHIWTHVYSWSYIIFKQMKHLWDNYRQTLFSIFPDLDYGETWAKWESKETGLIAKTYTCLLYTSPSPRDGLLSRMPSSA